MPQRQAALRLPNLDCPERRCPLACRKNCRKKCFNIIGVYLMACQNAGKSAVVRPKKDIINRRRRLSLDAYRSAAGWQRGKGYIFSIALECGRVRLPVNLFWFAALSAGLLTYGPMIMRRWLYWCVDVDVMHSRVIRVVIDTQSKQTHTQTIQTNRHSINYSGRLANSWPFHLSPAKSFY